MHICYVIVAADQRQERSGRMKARVTVGSLGVDLLKPHLFLTGGSDALGGRACTPDQAARASSPSRPFAHMLRGRCRPALHPSNPSNRDVWAV